MQKEQKEQPKSFKRGLLQLIFAVFSIWFIIWQVTPILVEYVPGLAYYGQVAEENDIRPGALYYNDVPVTADAASYLRSTVRFLPHGGQNSENEDKGED